MCDRAVGNYPHTLRFVPECCKTHKMFEKAVGTHPSTTEYVPDQFKTQEMREKIVFDDSFQ